MDVSLSIADGPELSLQSLPYVATATDAPTDALRNPALALFLIHARLRDAAGLVSHIGPLRDMPERAYRLDSIPSAGPTSNMVGIMASDERAVDAASKALSAAGLATRVEVTRPAPGYLGIVLVDPKLRRRVNLADSGFGASQVLPIIVALASAAPGSFVLIQQPELHLHPESQVRVADVILALAESSNLGLVVESHSEHLLLRIQTRLALGEIDPTKFCLYFVDRSRVKRAIADSHGNLDTSRLPGDFFEEEWGEAVKLARARRDRRKK
jgi:hypothetical protein